MTQCGYDAMGRKTIEVSIGVSTNQFAYDGPGDLLTLTDGRNQVTTWHYDEFGRVTNKVDAANIVAFVYQYNTGGLLTNRWTPAKGNTAYSYDSLGNRTNITYGGQSSIAFAFDELSRRCYRLFSARTFGRIGIAKILAKCRCSYRKF